MIVEIIVLLLSIPIGFLIAWFARDELKSLRKWIRALVIVSIIGMVFGWFSEEYYLVWTFAFIFVVSIISSIKSNDEKWTKFK